MEFTEMRDRLMKYFGEMVKDVDHLFEVEVDKDELWTAFRKEQTRFTGSVGSMTVVVVASLLKQSEMLL